MNIDNFVGLYRLESQENFDALLVELGLTRISRKVLMMMKPTMEVKVEGDQWTVIHDAPIQNIVWKFQLGKEVTIRGVKGKALAIFTTEDTNKLVMNPGPSAKPGSGCRFVRTFTPNGHTVKIEHIASGVVSTKYYKRCEMEQ
ncbi:hypothetical protein Pmani_028848 [Petrolisthes manimaculis]|uniref:Cytosolic fatty-acid binding proteins domain-containing protein n=1 Tax=Petrolisthes manimaculis TaxID=1843537 RepID=A0AAE1NYQ4_9EUCA|nr:hypothetical protein Pmani_028848 [Petrolisthes manimaculis]